MPCESCQTKPATVQLSASVTDLSSGNDHYAESYELCTDCADAATDAMRSFIETD